MTGRGSRQSAQVERWLPLGYFVAAVLLVVTLLPTVLRPPQAEPNATAELSPDAPPDDEQQAIIAGLDRAQSTTAGTPTDPDLETLDATPVTVPVTIPKARTHQCFGNPARQTELVYSPPCAPPWQGSNGGSTWKNVTADEVRVAITLPLGNASEEGFVDAMPTEGASAATRSMQVMQQYFNRRYQFWGRTLRIVQIDGDDDSVEASRAAAVRADEQYKAFAAIHEFPAFGEEFARRNLVMWGNGWPAQDYLSRAPNYWAWLPDLNKEGRLGAEYACKKLNGKPAEWAGFGVVGQPRVFGVIANYEDNRRYRSSHFADPFASMCGGQAVGADFDGLDDPSAITTALSRMRSNNVTTIVVSTDVAPTLSLMTAASAQGYYPEWFFIHGSGCLTCNAIAQLMPQDQMEHGFGLSAWEIPRAASESECTRAYRSIDPTQDPDGFFCSLGFLQLVQVANGIQMAGPELTPKTFEQGLFRMGRSTVTERWAIKGDYSPGDYTWMDAVAEVWWDRNSNDPGTGVPGAYRYVRDGRRTREGGFTTEPSLLFSDGITSG